jgi:uracil phosphoribosyltransferase
MLHNQTAIFVFIDPPLATGGTITTVTDNGVIYYVHTFM